MILAFNKTIIRWAVVTADDYVVDESMSAMRRETNGWAAKTWTSKEWAALKKRGWRVEKIHMLLEHIE